MRHRGWLACVAQACIGRATGLRAVASLPNIGDEIAARGRAGGAPPGSRKRDDARSGLDNPRRADEIFA
jgi:hypothetical protein